MIFYYTDLKDHSFKWTTRGENKSHDAAGILKIVTVVEYYFYFIQHLWNYILNTMLAFWQLKQIFICISKNSFFCLSCNGYPSGIYLFYCQKFNWDELLVDYRTKRQIGLFSIWTLNAFTISICWNHWNWMSSITFNKRVWMFKSQGIKILFEFSTD